ncbi:MAG: N-6 DNA methylase [Ruminococcus sp.]|uniref:Eco57I restriction-modification methylase domain-containing protein n=1 Tax=Ruminococcus sp. TaxID=41978 RepID=UPI0025CE38BF|nr:N-6 DNA methylase [Ruminococcus sp.]MCR5601455.1 N-6 DNA methylase [Ruminococcus sp.]
MDNSVLKKFAAKARSVLLKNSSEECAYFGFMRLCSLFSIDVSAVYGILSVPEKLRSALFREKCGQLEEIYGGIFSLKSELPVPPQLLADGGTAAELLRLPRDFFGSISVLGRLHQYYNEPYRNEIAVGLKNSKRLSSDKIAAATQIFTPEWVVKYMVQNTLTRYLREHSCDVGDGEYIIGGETADRTNLCPEEITFIDPCMGSGNILLYAFDVFMELYRSCGYSDKTAAEKVLCCNLYGLELDERVCAVAETALRFKAQQYGADVLPQVCDFSGISDTAGSLLKAEQIADISSKAAVVRKLLSRKYTVVVTNPPYLGKPAMNTELSAFVRENYNDYSADIFSVFAARCMDMLEQGGYLGLLTPATWLFLQSYEKMRLRIYSECSVQTLIHFEYSAFDDATVPLCAFTANMGRSSSKGTYLRLTDIKGGMELQRQKVLEAAFDKESPYRYEADADVFRDIPSAPAAYWLGKAALQAFSGTKLGEVFAVREGLITGDNDRFLRRWFEVDQNKTAFKYSPDKKWYLLNKGGEFRRWYGNREFVVNWENDGEEIKNFRDNNGKLRSRPQGLNYNFHPSVSWSQITNGGFSVRYFDENFMFNVAGTSVFPENEKQLLMLLGLLNSCVVSELSRVLNPTLNMNPGDIARLPLPDIPDECTEAEKLIRENIRFCRDDWDSFETAYDFRRHPLI